MKTTYALLQIFWGPLLVISLVVGGLTHAALNSGPVNCVSTGPDAEECF